MATKTHACSGHPRRAVTGTVRWTGTGYARLLLAHGALAQMHAARARHAS